MPSSFDVTLPRSVTPVFPDRCPCGGGPTNGKAVRLSFVGYSRTPSLIDYALDINTASGNTLDYAVVPASAACARRLRRYHFWIKVFKYVTWAPLFLAALYLHLPIFLSVIILLAALIVPVIWEITHPPAVGATPYPDKIGWEFADRAYAEEFARLNNAKVG
jgi:hypothetical protein